MSTNFCIKYLVLKLDQIESLHIELSSRCQASCPLCKRNMYGYYERPDFEKTDLTLKKIKTIFDNVDLNIKEIIYNGNFGDPCINPELAEITEYFYNKFPTIKSISVSTNGGMHKPEWWANLGKKFPKGKLCIDFCIDGLEDTNQLYRIGVPFKKAMENAKAFMAAGGMANWRFVVFKHNQHQIGEARKLSKESGFCFFILNDQGRDDGYVKTGENQGYWIEPADYKNRPDRVVLPENKNGDHIEYDNFLTKVGRQEAFSKEKSWIQSKSLNCEQHLLRKMVYINSVGELYPCCYLGFNPKTYELKNYNLQLKNILKDYNNNLLEVDWTTAIEWFNVIEEGWKKNSVKDGMIAGCIMCCHNKRPYLDVTKN